MIYGDDNDMLVEGPLLPEGAPWRCPYCGESYQFQTHPDCLAGALRERDEARADCEKLLRSPRGDRRRRWKT